MCARSLAVILLAACAPPGEEKHREETVARAAVAAESAKAAVAATLPNGGRWDEAHLVERLVRSGLAPQALPHEKGEPYWDTPVLAYRINTATLFAYLYPDSVARRRVTAGMDTLTAAPRGAPSPYAKPHLLIVQNNLAAVLLGATERQAERVTLALTAGLPSAGER